MTIAGSIYGVILNDIRERESLTSKFVEKPYSAPPRAPVVYMKAHSTVTRGAIIAPAGAVVDAAPTLALLFARDAAMVTRKNALSYIGGVALALDVSLPQADYYRPAVVQKNGDGFLPIGPFAPTTFPSEIQMEVDGEAKFQWSLDRLYRSVDRLIADLSSFMTLQAGDILLVGLPGDAPRLSAGKKVRVMADGLPPLHSWVEEAQP